MTAPFLELDRISAGYHGRPVLNGVSLGLDRLGQKVPGAHDGSRD